MLYFWQLQRLGDKGEYCPSTSRCFRYGVKFMIDQRMGRRVIRVEKTDAAGGLYEARLRPVGFGASHSVCSSSVPIGS